VIPATARNRLRRARNQLRRELEAMESADPRDRGRPAVRPTTEERT
jgi:hypothetical protein